MRHFLMCTLAALVLACCLALPAWAECPLEAKADGERALNRALALIEGAGQGQEATVLLTEPDTGTTVTPNAAPEEPRPLTAEELERMEAARPDTSLPPPEPSGP